MKVSLVLASLARLLGLLIPNAATCVTCTCGRPRDLVRALVSVGTDCVARQVPHPRFVNTDTMRAP
jgi:hypothetical protein